jgi:hypothetical protein
VGGFVRASTAAVAVLAAATTILFGLDSDAQALRNYKLSGKPGRATYYQVGGWTVPFANHSLQLPGPTVYRSKASRKTQKVYVKRYLLKRIPSSPGEGPNPWRVEATRSTYGYISPRRKRTFKPWNLAAQAYVSYHAIYRVTYYAQAGRRLGRAYVDYNSTGDYHCNTDNCYTLIAVDRAAITFTY